MALRLPSELLPSQEHLWQGGRRLADRQPPLPSHHSAKTEALQPTQATHPTPPNPPSLRLLASITRGKGLLGDTVAHPSPPNQKEVDQTKPG